MGVVLGQGGFHVHRDWRAIAYLCKVLGLCTKTSRRCHGDHRRNVYAGIFSERLPRVKAAK